MGALTYILISLAFSAFFSGMEIAFISSNKLRFELDKKEKSLTSKILDIFYRNPHQFISTMLVGNNIALVVYGLQMAIILEPLIARVVNNEALIVLTQSIISTILPRRGADRIRIQTGNGQNLDYLLRRGRTARRGADLLRNCTGENRSRLLD